MGNHLVTIQIEIDPFAAAATFWATQKPAIEGARGA
jgi:hypothetical protein